MPERCDQHGNRKQIFKTDNISEFNKSLTTHSHKTKVFRAKKSKASNIKFGNPIHVSMFHKDPMDYIIITQKSTWRKLKYVTNELLNFLLTSEMSDRPNMEEGQGMI